MNPENKEPVSGRLDRLVRLVAVEAIGRAKRACESAAASHQGFFLEPTNFRNGWVAGAKACENAIEEHVARDIEEITARVLDSLPNMERHDAPQG